MTDRPLSPHLSTFKWGPHMLVSILHRVTGDGLAIVGLGVAMWWLYALASGPAAYETFTWAATSPVGYLVLVGLSWAFFNHLCSGVRHFLMDAGMGFEIKANRAGSIASMVIAILLTAAFWAKLILL